YAANVTANTADGVLQGLDGIRTLYNTYTTAFPDCRITVSNIIAEGDRVAAPYTFAGTQRGELNGIPASGRQVTIQGIVTARIAQGKIVEEQVVWDTLSLVQQLGASPQQIAQARQAAR
ncbi:MAG: ester cyclase, partial [Bryobacteraceae bacterium]